MRLYIKSKHITNYNVSLKYINLLQDYSCYNFFLKVMTECIFSTKKFYIGHFKSAEKSVSSYFAKSTAGFLLHSRLLVLVNKE